MALGNSPEHDTGDALTEDCAPDTTGSDGLAPARRRGRRRQARRSTDRQWPGRCASRESGSSSPRYAHCASSVATTNAPCGPPRQTSERLTPSNLERVVAGTHRTAIASAASRAARRGYARIAPETRGASTTVDSDTLRPAAAPRSRSRASRGRADRSTCRVAQRCRRTGQSSQSAKKPRKTNPPIHPHEARRKALRVCGRGRRCPTLRAMGSN